MSLLSQLSAEDAMVQSMPDASPSKWHAAHTSWFFDAFVLTPFLKGWASSELLMKLFNSYYRAMGGAHPRVQRGVLSRPSLSDIYDYRARVDDAVEKLVCVASSDVIRERILLGINHEQQHQELLLTDIKHAFSINPMRPKYASMKLSDPMSLVGQRFVDVFAGLHDVGASSRGFSFDNERPAHTVYLMPFRLSNRPVTNREFAEFIRAGGYDKPGLWLDDGWNFIKSSGVSRPLYWNEDNESTFSLYGDQSIDWDAPVCHVSFFEAEAFARWAEARLPTEFEWEVVASQYSACDGTFLESELYRPAVTSDSHGVGVVHALLGDVWEWTASAYVPYPGFAPDRGAIGEYNGKFMNGSRVLRGGSCVTPRDHARPSYRNFFSPESRWQFSGIRLARSQ